MSPEVLTELNYHNKMLRAQLDIMSVVTSEVHLQICRVCAKRHIDAIADLHRIRFREEM